MNASGLTALAALADITQPTATRVASRLVQMGLVQRSARSGRSAPLRLTVAGKHRAEALQRARLAVLDGIVGGLSEAERAMLDRAVDALLDSATVSRAFARTTCRLCDHATCDAHRCPVGAKATTLWN